MSKLSKCVVRFENVRIGLDERKLDSNNTPIGDDIRPVIRVTGLKGKTVMELMDLIDEEKNKEALKFLTLSALQEDDPTTTEEEFDKHLQMADMLAIANARTKLSGLGEMFDLNSQKKNTLLKNEQQSTTSHINSFREKVKNGEI